MLLAWPALACAFAAPHPGTDEPTSTRAAAFDATLRKVTGPESLDSSSDAYDADLERLRALLPADDPARDVRFRSVYCGSSKWKDIKRGLEYSDTALKLARDARDPASEARAILATWESQGEAAAEAEAENPSPADSSTDAKAVTRVEAEERPRALGLAVLLGLVGLTLVSVIVFGFDQALGVLAERYPVAFPVAGMLVLGGVFLLLRRRR